MRYAIALVFGLAVTAVTRALLDALAGSLGLVIDIPLPYPLERSYGRGAEDVIDSDATLLGMARFGMSVAIGVFAGSALYRRTLMPWRKAQECITARAWYFYLIFLVLYSAFFQLVFGPHTTGLVEVLEYTPPLYVGWRTWKWWKKNHAVAVASDHQA